MDAVMKTFLTLTTFDPLCGAALADEPAAPFLTPS